MTHSPTMRPPQFRNAAGLLKSTLPHHTDLFYNHIRKAGKIPAPKLPKPRSRLRSRLRDQLSRQRRTARTVTPGQAGMRETTEGVAEGH